MFLLLCVILFTGDGVSLIDTPLTETPPWTEIPQTETRHPGQRPPTVKSGRYASYWNSFLLNVVIHIQAPAGSEPPYYWNVKTINEADVGGNPDPTPVDVWILNGYLWGFTPSNVDIYYDTHTGCT